MQPKIAIYSTSMYTQGFENNLSNEDYDLKLFESELVLKESAHKEKFDLIILDTKQGEHLTRLSEYFNQSKKNNHTPFLYVSTGRVEFTSETVTNGVTVLFLQKPFSKKNFIHNVRILIQNKKQRTELKTLLKESIKKSEVIEAQKAKLIENAKLSALGEMAGGVAHEINNPLTIISLTSKLMERKLLKGKLTDESIKKALSDINETVLRIEKIIRGLKNVSRTPNKENLDRVSFREIFSDVLGLCSEKFKNNGVDIRIDLSQDQYNNIFLCDRVQISQVLINLLGNSFDAIEGLDERWVKIDLFDGPDSFFLTILDSGTGISQEIQNKMFNPFFTSKEIGKGTGLGLSISQSIIKKHGGEININNSESNTCFEISFPKENIATTKAG